MNWPVEHLAVSVSIGRRTAFQVGVTQIVSTIGGFEPVGEVSASGGLLAVGGKEGVSVVCFFWFEGNYSVEVDIWLL